MGKVMKLREYAQAKKEARARAAELAKILSDTTELETLRRVFQSEPFLDKVAEILLTAPEQEQA